MHIYAVQNTVLLAKIGRRKRKSSRDGAGGHVAPNLQLIGKLRDGAVKPLLLLGTGRFRINQLLAQQRFDLMAYEFQLFGTVAIDCEVKSEAKEMIFAYMQFVTHFLCVLVRVLYTWVNKMAFFGVY